MTLFKTKTYIAADWTNDEDAISILRKWNKDNRYKLSFTDAHDITQSRDTSLNCNIKKSLKKRIKQSKTFVLVVGNKTKNLTAGQCKYCKNYNEKKCSSGYSINNDSYIEYECKQAIKANLKLIILHKSTTINKMNCPDIIKYKGKHLPMKYRTKNGKIEWNYKDIKTILQPKLYSIHKLIISFILCCFLFLIAYKPMSQIIKKIANKFKNLDLNS